MRLGDVKTALAAELAWSANHRDWADREVRFCNASDLMSDVLTFRAEGSLLLTGLTNPQVVRTSEMLDAIGICFVRGKSPQPETVALAEAKGLPLLVTPLSMFEACGRLYASGLRGADTERETSWCLESGPPGSKS
jgi:hypothetical protein